MSDLIKRLREAAKSMDVLPGGGRVISLETQAADEIERLREALKLIADGARCPDLFPELDLNSWELIAKTAMTTARAMLAENK